MMFLPSTFGQRNDIENSSYRVENNNPVLGRAALDTSIAWIRVPLSSLHHALGNRLAIFYRKLVRLGTWPEDLECVAEHLGKASDLVEARVSVLENIGLVARSVETTDFLRTATYEEIVRSLEDGSFVTPEPIYEAIGIPDGDGIYLPPGIAFGIQVASILLNEGEGSRQ